MKIGDGELIQATPAAERGIRQAVFAEVLAKWRDGSLDSMEFDDWLEAESGKPSSAQVLREVLAPIPRAGAARPPEPKEPSDTPFDGVTDAEADTWPNEIHRLRGLCYFALDRLPDDEPRGEAAGDAVDRLCQLAGAARPGVVDPLREAAQRMLDAWTEAGFLAFDDHWEGAHDAVESAAGNLRATLSGGVSPRAGERAE